MTLHLGDMAPAFRLPDWRGVTHDLSLDAGGKGALVLFLCNHCPYVKHIASKLGILADAWMGAGLEIFGVNSNAGRHPGDSVERMPVFAAERGWTFPYLVDQDQSIAAAFGAQRTPDLFLFDAQLRLVYAGQFDDSRPSLDAPVTGFDLDAAVRAVLDGRAPSHDQKAGAGCAIKWDDERLAAFG